MKYACLFLAALAAPAVHAVRTESLSSASYAAFFSGQLEDVSLDNRGALRAGPALEELFTLEDTSIWSAALAPDGTLYLGTGNAGKVYRWTDGMEEPELVFAPDTVMTRALAVDAEGNLFVGTSPDGAVYRIAPGGRPEVFFDPEELYVWDLLLGEDGQLYVATGGEAKIYRLGPDHRPSDEATVYFETDRSHFTRLAWDASGGLLATSAPEATLYRVTGEGEGQSLYYAGTDEIACLAVSGEAVYFSTWHNQEGDGLPPDNLAALLARFLHVPNGNGEDNGNGNGKKDDEPSGAPAANAPSFLLRLGTDGFALPVWSPGGSNIQSMALASDGSLLVGTTSEGRLFSVRAADQWRLLNQAERAGEVSAIAASSQDEGATYICTSNPAAVYRLAKKPAEESLYTSEPLDAGAVARWGRIRPLGAPDAAQGVAFETRTGNSAEPDDTWSDWAELDDGVVASEPARYLQYRTRFTEADAALRGLTLYFGARNLAPLVTMINVLPVGLDIMSSRSPMRPPLNPQELIDPAKSAAMLAKGPPENTKIMVAEDTGFVTVAWMAGDPNGDALRYAVAVQRDGDSEWITLVDDSQEKAFSAPTRGLADGYYTFRVVASDAPSNLPAEALSGERLSEPFLIDNHGPEVTLHSQTKDADGVLTLVFVARDDWGVITDAHYRLDGGKAVEAVPADLLFDSTDEIFRLPLDDLKPGAHSIVFEAVDERGNRGVAQASFER